MDKCRTRRNTDTYLRRGARERSLTRKIETVPSEKDRRNAKHVLLAKQTRRNADSDRHKHKQRLAAASDLF